MKIIIVGGGKIVHFLTKSFLSKGYDVTIIHEDHEYCKKLSRKHPKTTIVHGKPSNPVILEDAGAFYSDALIAVTLQDPANLIVCQIAEKMYQIPKTFALVNDPKNIEIFNKLGVTKVISTASIVSSMIEQKVLLEDMINLTPIEEGKLALVEVVARPEHPMINQTMENLQLPEDSLVGCIIREGRAIIPRGKDEILTGDRLVVLCLPEVQSQVMKTLLGRVE